MTSAALVFNGEWDVVEQVRGSFVYRFEISENGTVSGNGRSASQERWTTVLEGLADEHNIKWTEYDIGNDRSQPLGEFRGGTLSKEDNVDCFPGTGVIFRTGSNLRFVFTRRGTISG